MKASIISYHYYESKKKASLHFIAEALSDLGWEVLFVCGNFSALQLLKNDKRMHETGFLKNIFFEKKIGNIKSAVNFNIAHPHIIFSEKTNIILERFVLPSKKIKKEIESSDLIIFESDPSVLLNKKLNIKPSSKLLLRLNDDPAALNLSENVIKKLNELQQVAEITSCPNQIVFNNSTAPRKRIHLHGIDKESFDQETENPYSELPFSKKKNLVFVGNSYLDYETINTISSLSKEYFIHIIGPFTPAPKENIKFYGYMKFEETIKYIKYADAGLHTRFATKPLMETLGDSLKVLQYSYCNLPIISPEEIKTNRKNVFKYKRKDTESIKRAVESALETHTKFSNKDILSWKEVTLKILSDLRFN